MRFSRCLLLQRVSRDGELLVEAHVRVAFVAGGRAHPIPKPLRIAMQADHERASNTENGTR